MPDGGDEAQSAVEAKKRRKTKKEVEVEVEVVGVLEEVDETGKKEGEEEGDREGEEEGKIGREHCHGCVGILIWIFEIRKCVGEEIKKRMGENREGY